MKFLFTAESDCFGPCAKACAIAAHIRSFYPKDEIVFVGDGTALQLALSKTELFDEIVCSTDNSFDKILNDHNPDTVISVMHPERAIVAKNMGYKTYTVDSMFWYWQWDRLKGKDFDLSSLVRDFKKLSAGAVVQALDSLSPHERYAVAHVIADAAFIQTIPQVDKCPNITHLKKWRDQVGNSTPTNVRVVGPIIDRTHLEDNKNRDVLLISFSGQRHPKVTDNDILLWTRCILFLLHDQLKVFAEHNPGIRIHFAGNAEILEMVKGDIYALGLPNISCGQLNNKEMFNTLARSVASVFCGSFTSFFEAAAYQTPAFILPEQSRANWKNYELFTEGREDVASIFPGVLLGHRYPKMLNDLDSDLSSLFFLYSRIYSGKEPDIKQSMDRAIGSFLVDVISKGPLMANRQSSYVGNFCAFGIDGAKTIVDRIRMECESLCKPTEIFEFFRQQHALV